MRESIECRIRRVTKHGYAFIESMDENASGGVFVSLAVIERSGEMFNVGDRVAFDERVDRGGRRWASSVNLIERAAQKPKPTVPTIRRTAIVKNDFDSYLFVRDELNGRDIFVPGGADKRCGVQLGRLANGR